MITLRKRMAGPGSKRMLMPALLFFTFASFSAAGAGAVAALCLVPAGLVIDAARSTESDDDAGHA